MTSNRYPLRENPSSIARKGIIPPALLADEPGPDAKVLSLASLARPRWPTFGSIWSDLLMLADVWWFRRHLFADQQCKESFFWSFKYCKILQVWLGRFECQLFCWRIWYRGLKSRCSLPSMISSHWPRSQHATQVEHAEQSCGYKASMCLHVSTV